MNGERISSQCEGSSVMGKHFVLREVAGQERG